MKIKLIFLLAIVSFSFADAQIVNIPDPILKSTLLGASSSNGTASSQTPVYNATSNFWYVTSYNSIDTNGDGEIQVSEAQAIKWLGAVNLNITDITGIEAFTNLEYLALSGNLLESFPITNLTHLKLLNVGHNNLQSLDVTSFSSLNQLWCYNNQLQSLFIKNNANWDKLGFDSNFDIQYVCADENDLAFVQSKIDSYGYTSCHVNSYCSFTPGGTFYTIQGNNRWDSNNNGCDANDNPYPNLKLNITNGSLLGSLICNNQGNYAIPLQAGTYTLTPSPENPSYYTAPAATISLPAAVDPFNQDFCITPNGIHHDVEVTIIPTSAARPGSDAYYRIVYKNKGTAIENGSIQFSYDDAVLDFVSANPIIFSLAANTLTWNYTNLQPLETRTIDVVLNVNSPTETPAVHIGDQLNYTVTITPLTTDEFQFDNTSSLKQIVVGSFDPNDKTCIEGTTVGPDRIGQYVHYVIRFENTGTASAENIVVKDMIDTTKFDVSTLIPLHSSHNFITRINGNKVEFIFEGINLPFDDANNDGYVAFKIKTKSNLVVGDTFSNNANIYFDYNFPITTNTFTTTITALNATNFDSGTHFTLYPNPVKDVLNFNSQETIIKAEVYDIAGRILSLNSVNDNKLNLSNLPTGNYILRIYTENGIKNTKIIKE